jgi:aspartate/methionine/tyrosine aminotransferase
MTTPDAPKETDTLNSFRRVPRTGVIYVSVEAGKRGFHFDAPGWCNLGQGQPETTPLPGAPARVTSIPVLPEDLDYAPVPGLPAMREAVADLYNRQFRKGLSSKYTAENVALCGGGRVAIMRALAAIGPVHLGHFLPDYTAYEEALDIFGRFQPIPLLLDPDMGYAYPIEELRREVLGLGLGAILMSNPCNPTGKLIQGDELASWVETARDLGCALLIDEFYSHYAWAGDRPIVSAAEFVEDVNRDPIVLFDGLTKNWRYPGFRVSWIVGPKQVIESVASAGSFIDGGGSAPMQRLAVDLVQHDATMAETKAIHEIFSKKRALLIDGLRRVGVRFDVEPEGTFYGWGDLSDLPPSLRSGDDFFRAALDRKVICVPGHFFDVNPGKRRPARPSRFRNHVRFSFGPSIEVIEEAIGRIEEMVRQAE